MRIIKPAFNKLVKSNIASETFYLTYLVSARASNSNYRECLFDDDRLFNTELKHLFPVLKKLESHLWSYRTIEGSCFMIAMPVYGYEDANKEKAYYKEKTYVERVLAEIREYYNEPALKEEHPPVR
jgi:hypothetical protein